MSRNALGRGLEALIRNAPPVPATLPGEAETYAAGPSTRAASDLQAVDIDLIEPSPFQPRTQFPEESLAELAQSIQTTGIIQPLIVRRSGGRFQLLAGERRWRAAQRAGLTRVPAV